MVCIGAGVAALTLPAVGLGSTRAAAAVTGTSCQWSVVDAPSGALPYANRLEAVVSLAANDAWAVGWLGGQAAIEHWDGTAWAITPIPSVAGASQSRLLGIDASSPSDVWAVGYAITSSYHTLTMHWNGSVWAIVASPDQSFPGQTVINALNDVAVLAPSDVWAVGGDIRNFNAQASEALLMHWDGTNWTLATPPDESFNTASASRFAIDGVSSSDVWALGTIGELRWNGSRWAYAGNTSQATLGVSAIATNDVIAVGTTPGVVLSEGGQIPPSPFATRWNGTLWTPTQLPYVDGVKGFGATSVRAVDARNATDAWAVGSTGKGTYVAHLDATGWTQTPSPDAATNYTSEFVHNDLFGVSARAADDVWAVGEHVTTSGAELPLVLHYTCGTNPPPPPVATLAAVALTPASTVGGTPSTVTITLTAPAPAGGATVVLRSSQTKATVPATAFVSAGATSTTVTVSTQRVASTRTATITATYGGLSRSATLTITRR